MEPSRIPPLLREIADPPAQLYLRGPFPDPSNYSFLTVIGSRKYSSYGKQVCQRLIEGLRGYPIVIVSGLALGIDSVAHKAALDNNLLTLAVPGSGLDDRVLYPASNRGLAHRILLSGGCLLSEYEPDFKATNWSFPKRNRIMAGLSHATLVIEAENISGTRITARLATEYNREVFAVPGSIFSESSKGTNELIREGATPVTSAEDILAYFGFHHHTQRELDLTTLSPEEQIIMKLLIEPQTRNQLSENSKMGIVDLNILLSSMEIKGLVREQGGKIERA